MGVVTQTIFHFEEEISVEKELTVKIIGKHKSGQSAAARIIQEALLVNGFKVCLLEEDGAEQRPIRGSKVLIEMVNI